MTYRSRPTRPLTSPDRADVTVRIHPTAIVEPGVEIGDGTAVWDSVHIRAPATIGSACLVGEKTYIAYGVWIGDRVKINAFVYVCSGVTLEAGVMVAAGCVFTNDRYPRATDPDLQALRASEPPESPLSTLVREGATIGARTVVGPGLEIGRFAMVGMGSVVVRPVPDFHLVVGNPARTIGYVCRCGAPLAQGAPPDLHIACPSCSRAYVVDRGAVTELRTEPAR
jgi:UDP-2-acetamido-3-amino-2,3-dideoxy-glucuronate N-acetyltransferase